VDWLYQPSPGTKAHHIISAGYLINGDHGGRLNISGSNLIISSVNKNDSGIYKCVEDSGLGTEHHISVTVQSGNFSD